MPDPTTTGPDNQTQLQRLMALGVIPMQPQQVPLQPTDAAKLTPMSAPTLQPVGQPISPGGLQKINLAGDPADRAPLTRKEQIALPTASPGVPAGSLASNQAKLEKLQLQDQGTPWNERSGWSKLGHVASKIGNIAGDVLIPRVMATIPGTELNRTLQEQGLQGELNTQQKEQNTEESTKAAQKLAGEKEADEEKLHEAQEKNYTTKDEEALSKAGLMRDKDGNVVADPTSQAYQKQQLAGQAVKNLMDYRSAQSDLTEAKEEVERAKNDPNSPAFKAAQQKLAMAQYAHDLAAQNLGLHRDEFANKVQEQELLKPSGQAQSRASAAESVLQLMPGLEQEVKKNAASMGPLMGRLERGELAIGDVPPDVAQLYAAMKSFYALQPAVHGFRNAEFVKDFETALGTLERDPDAFIAGMTGLKPTMEAVANEGKTYHKRIVEGGGNTPAGGAAGGAKPGAGNDPLGIR